MKEVYTITKQISKHGKQAVIVIPKILEDELPPGTVTEVQIKVIKPSLNGKVSAGKVEVKEYEA